MTPHHNIHGTPAHPAHPGAPRRPATGTVRAFTLIELLVAVGVLALIIGLLIVGLNRASKAAADAAGRMNVATLKTATSQFISQFGFPPPMIRDWEKGPIPNPKIYDYDAVAGEQRLYVYQPAVLADRNTLRRDPAPTSTPVGWGSEIDYYDIRYSNVSLPFYLAGACEEKGAATWQVPIDGVPGPGFLEPRQDGTFNVPGDLKSAGTVKSSRSTGRRFDAMVDTSKGGLRIVPSGDLLREFRDSQGRLYRYYLWIQGDPNGLKNTSAKLNIPRIILETMSRPEDRFKPLGTTNAADRRASLPELNAATWAILWPGPDGMFGDERIDELRAKLGVSDGVPELKVREMAIIDNVAEVGQ